MNLVQRRMCAAFSTASLLTGGIAHADVITDWNTVLLNTIRAKKTNPLVASRALAMMHIAMYDAVNSSTHPYQSYAYDVRSPSNTSLETAAAQAAHNVLTSVYGPSATFDNALASSLAAIPGGAGKTAGIATGIASANAILGARSADGSTAVAPPYTGGTDPGQWRPTGGAFAPGLLPKWGEVTPFSGFDVVGNRPAPPPSLTSDEYAAAYNEVKNLGAKTGSTRTDEQSKIALFWSDAGGTETPPGHWNAIAQSVAASQGNSLMQNARMFAMMNISLADSAICCWDTKYAYSFWRPVTAIQDAALDGNSSTETVAGWSPFIGTPPFPGYSSGHSTFSAAAATVLANFYGTDNIGFTATSDDIVNLAPGYTRTYSSFSSAASEAADSRVYGGIHFRFDSNVGLEAGQQIGSFTFNRVLQASAPEPAALALLIPGVLSMFLLRRRNRR